MLLLLFNWDRIRPGSSINDSGWSSQNILVMQKDLVSSQMTGRMLPAGSGKLLRINYLVSSDQLLVFIQVASDSGLVLVFCDHFLIVLSASFVCLIIELNLLELFHTGQVQAQLVD